MKPKISVIIPIYGTQKYLDKCIQSVRNQSFSDIEIICVDDCSLDNSYLIVERYMAEDARISLIRHEENLGLGGARNTAIKEAKADFIASVDSDDYIDPDMLEKLWLASENGKYDVVCCGFDIVNEMGEKQSSQSFSSIVIDNSDNSINIFANVNPAFWNKLWRRSLFIENDIFFPNHLYYEDLATTPRILSRVKYIKTIDSCLYHYLVRENSITQTYSSRHMLDYFKVFEVIREFLRDNKLSDRYKNEFTEYIESGVRYHTKNVFASSMSEGEKKQYLIHFLMLKVAFLEYHSAIELMSQEELLSLIKTAKSKEELFLGSK